MSEANILYGYLKTDLTTTFEIGEPKYPCNMLDNANEMKSSFKVIIQNSTEAAYEVNTICRHDDTSTYWVIVSDTSTYVGEDSDGTTKLYSHAINLDSALEYLSYKYLPPCVFPKDKYTLTEFFYRFKVIAGLDNLNTVFPAFLSSDYKMKYFSFRNNTVASAIKEVAKSINALPQLSVDTGELSLTFTSRYGGSSAALGDIDTIFPSRFRKSNSTSSQYTTRVYSDLQNAKDSNISVYPNSIGIKAHTPNSLAFDGNNSIIKMPHKIDEIEKIEVKMGYKVVYNTPPSTTVIETGDYAPVFSSIRDAIYNFNEALEEAKVISSNDILALDFNIEELQSINDTFGVNYPSATRSAFERYAVKNKKFYDELETSGAGSKENCFYWEDKSNFIIVPTKMDFGGESLMPFKIALIGDTEVASYELWFGLAIGDILINDNSNIYFKVHYKPIADITVSYDNDSEAQDERPYNQTGKLIDAYTASKLVSVYVDESAAETLVRNGEYYTFASIPDCGDKVSKSNINYVINQRSIDLVSEDLYQVEFNLSLARIARDENISADDSIEKGQIPDDNLMKRVHIYKDYVEFSIDSASEHTETPYMYNSPMFNFADDNGVGFDLKMDCVVKTVDGTETVIDYVYVPTTRHNLVREMIYRCDFDDNFIIGIKQNSSAVQTPIRYADANGEVDFLYLNFVDEELLSDTLSSADFSDLPQISSAHYATMAASASISLEIEYMKSSYEIPVFEYIYEFKGNINEHAQVILADNILERFDVRYSAAHFLYQKDHFYYIISSIPITQENALERWDTLFIDTAKDIDDENIALFLGGYIILYSTYASGNAVLNTTSISGKHIGIYAVSSETTETTPKFIMAINYYSYVNAAVETKDYYIPFFVNNWKI